MGFVDYSGMTVPLTNDPQTDLVRDAEIFIACMGSSNYTYAEATESQSLADWIDSHVRAFEFLGGVPELIIPDNLKSEVTKVCRHGIRPPVDMVPNGGQEGFTSTDLDRDLASAGDGVIEKYRNNSQFLPGTESSSNFCCISGRICVAKPIASSQINKAMHLQKVGRTLL